MEARFSALVQADCGAHPASCITNTGSLCASKAAGAWRPLRTPSSPKVKERVELYLYSPSGPLWPVVGRTLSLAVSLYAERAVIAKVNVVIDMLILAQGLQFLLPHFTVCLLQVAVKLSLCTS